MKNLPWIAMLVALGAVLQGFGAWRYASRMPGDYVGIGIYLSVFVLFIILAFVHYKKWVK